MNTGIGLDKQDMDLKVFRMERLQVKPLLTLLHCRDKLERQQSHPMLRAESEGRIQSLLQKWVVDLGTPRQDFTFTE